MPHVVIINAMEPEEYYCQFKVWKEARRDGTVLETRAAFLRVDRQVVLIQAVCLELGPAQHFFVAVEKKRNQLTVRCHPHPNPARTAGVKEIIVHVAREVLALGGEVGKTNLVL